MVLGGPPPQDRDHQALSGWSADIRLAKEGLKLCRPKPALRQLPLSCVRFGVVGSVRPEAVAGSGPSIAAKSARKCSAGYLSLQDDCFVPEAVVAVRLKRGKFWAETAGRVQLVLSGKSSCQRRAQCQSFWMDSLALDTVQNEDAQPVTMEREQSAKPVDFVLTNSLALNLEHEEQDGTE